MKQKNRILSSFRSNFSFIILFIVMLTQTCPMIYAQGNLNPDSYSDPKLIQILNDIKMTLLSAGLDSRKKESQDFIEGINEACAERTRPCLKSFFHTSKLTGL